VEAVVETLTVSKFKATCLAVLEEVHRKKKRVLITKRGKPIAEVVPPSGQDQRVPLRETVTHMGDVVSPVASDEWEASR
jgi:prevent-host-death family protein